MKFGSSVPIYRAIIRKILFYVAFRFCLRAKSKTKVQIYQKFFLFLCYFPLRRKVTKGTTKGSERLRFHPLPLESHPHRFVCANIGVCHPEYPAYAEYSLICLQALACPRAFFLLSGASFFFLSRKKGRKMRKNTLKYKQNNRLNQI